MKRAQATYNISGLINNPDTPLASLSPPLSPLHPDLKPKPDGDESDLEEDDEDLDLLIHFDSSEDEPCK